MTALFCAALLSSISISAQDRRDDDHDKRVQNRSYQPYYDSRHRDWHQWNDSEAQSYSRYAKEHHRDNDDFSKASEREQEQYWSWRHKHPDEH